MKHRHDPDDPEVSRPPADQQTRGLGLFDWPESPPAVKARQVVLPIPTLTLQARWEAWLQTADGARAFSRFCELARADAAAGFRLSARAIWEQCRATLRVEMNNSFTPLAAREAEARHPTLKGLFEKRRTSAI